MPELSDPYTLSGTQIKEYQKIDVPLIWVVDWDVETVHVFRRDNPEVLTLGKGDILDGGMLPDVKIDLAELFIYN